MPPPWVTSFRLAREDVAALLRPAHRFDVGADLRWLLAAGVAAGMAYGAIADEDPASPVAALAASGAAVVVILGGGQLWRRWRRARAVAIWPLPVESRVEIDRQAIRLVEDGRLRLVAWERAQEVSADKERVIVWLQPIADSVVLPRAAFDDEADMAAFHAYARERLTDDEDEAFGPPPDAPLSVEVTLTGDDVRRAAAGSGRPLSYLQTLVGATLIGAIALGGAALLVARGFGVEADMSSPWLWGALVGALGGAGLAGYALDQAQARGWRDWRAAPARLTIDAQGLRRVAAGQEARVDWRAIDRIETRPHALLLRTGEEAYVAPLRCFADADAFEAFADAAQAWRRAALSAPPSTPRDAP